MPINGGMDKEHVCIYVISYIASVRSTGSSSFNVVLHLDSLHQYGQAQTQHTEQHWVGKHINRRTHTELLSVAIWEGALGGGNGAEHHGVSIICNALSVLKNGNNYDKI